MIQTDMISGIPTTPDLAVCPTSRLFPLMPRGTPVTRMVVRLTTYSICIIAPHDGRMGVVAHMLLLSRDL